MHSYESYFSRIKGLLVIAYLVEILVKARTDWSKWSDRPRKHGNIIMAPS